ncbi:MAG: sporulation protein YunB [Clostridia bacterium]|nr:sporulation protein YunB [Clostridia bacterium]
MRFYAKKLKKKHITFFLLVTALLITLLCEYVWNSAQSRIYDIAKANATTEIDNCLNNISSTLKYNDIAKINYSEDGKVSSVYTNEQRINSLKNELCDKICSCLVNSEIVAEIKLGDAFSSHWTIGKGIKISVYLSSYSAKVIEIKTKTESCGINQTLFKIYADIEIKFNMLLPNRRTETVNINRPITLYQTLIIGDVPSVYRQSK